MLKRLRVQVATAVAASAVALSLVPATPAAAQTHDCRILGPNYVEEVVDCAYLILSLIAPIDDPIG